MNPVKPGWTTSEFWLTLLPNIALVVALFAPQLGVKLADPATIKAVALIAAAVANIAYTVSRSRVKVAASHPLAYAPVPATLPHANLGDGELVDHFPEPAGYDKVPAASAAVKAKRRR